MKLTVSRAFSLVEVLLAILILALGLLGLGAVIPVVVKQQRTATDMTLGVTVAKDAEAALLSKPQFNPAAYTGVNAWDHLLADTNNWSSEGTNSDDHLWHPWERPRNWLQPDTGNMLFNSQNSASAQRVELLMRDRLWPSQSMQVVEFQRSGEDRYRPQFVWDFVGRRIRTAAGAPPAIQVAIFVRRIDLNIRVPRATSGSSPTLRDVLTGENVSANDRCVPVAVVSSTDPTPTNRGNTTPGVRNYANFLTLNASYSPARRDRIILSSGSFSSQGTGETLLTLASQPNQRLVDNFGNIYIVQRTDETLTSSTSVAVIVSPQIPTNVPNPTGSPSVDDFRQVVFTPQVPGAVRVFTVTRPIK